VKVISSLNKRVLVAFYSKYGYVEEIVKTISDILSGEGLQVDLLNLEKISKSKWPSIDEYNGIIVGSCMSSLMTFWKKEVKNFININLDKFMNTNKTLGFFYSDPRILNLILNPKGAKKVSENTMNAKFGFIPKFCDDFGPAFDLAHGFKKLSPEDRDRIRGKVKKISKETGIEFNYKGFNDFRDWNKIQEFTQSFSKMIREGRI
jgi:menaquinone-dependent protoporphyrinogen IX oxidase